MAQLPWKPGAISEEERAERDKPRRCDCDLCEGDATYTGQLAWIKGQLLFACEDCREAAGKEQPCEP